MLQMTPPQPSAKASSPPDHATTKLDRPTKIWHDLLKSISIFNIILWFITAWFAPIHSTTARIHRALSAIYAAVCAFRSFYPRVDLERTVLVNHWLSNIALGRASATIAEMAFIVQCGLSLQGLAERTGVSSAQTVGMFIVPLIFVAQCCCWMGVLTRNNLWHALEESLWSVMIALVATVLVELWPHTTDTPIVYFLPMAFIGCLVSFYVIAICDVPMYIARHKEGNANGTNKFLTLKEGIKDSTSKMIPTGNWAVWKHEVGWMTPYFSLGVWLSIAMVWMNTHHNEEEMMVV